MFKSGDHNSFMLLGLANTLANKGMLTEKERSEIINLGYAIDEVDLLRKADRLVSEIEGLLDNG